MLWHQIVGRGLRPYPGKDNILVLDAGGNFARHGAINAEIGSGDSRAGLWDCTDAVVRSPFKKGSKDGTPVPDRERSAIRFPVHSAAQPEYDLRIALGLMAPDAEPCGFLNDAEHLTCRQCGRPRQGFLTVRTHREAGERGIGDDDSYEIHDEANVVLADEVCRETRTLPVHDMQIEPEGNGILNFKFVTDFGAHPLRLDFDRASADPKFYAMARKMYERSTGRKAPGEGYRVLLSRELIPKPVDITLTKWDDGQVFLTEVRWVREGKMEAFRYDPEYS